MLSASRSRRGGCGAIGGRDAGVEAEVDVFCTVSVGLGGADVNVLAGRVGAYCGASGRAACSFKGMGAQLPRMPQNRIARMPKIVRTRIYCTQTRTALQTGMAKSVQIALTKRARHYKI